MIILFFLDGYFYQEDSLSLPLDWGGEGANVRGLRDDWNLQKVKFF